MPDVAGEPAVRWCVLATLIEAGNAYHVNACNSLPLPAAP
jgi:hypothetical protein